MDPADWDIQREGRQWTREEFDRRVEFDLLGRLVAGGIFGSERERLTVLGMLLENLGIHKVVRFGKLADWKARLPTWRNKAPPGLTIGTTTTITDHDSRGLFEPFDPGPPWLLDQSSFWGTLETNQTTGCVPVKY